MCEDMASRPIQVLRYSCQVNASTELDGPGCYTRRYVPLSDGQVRISTIYGLEP